MVPPAVSDHLTLAFADGTHHRLVVDAGSGQATLEAIISRSGVYETGWIEGASERERLNLAMVVSIRLTLDPDQPFHSEPV
jgi:hypothetical protein